MGDSKPSIKEWVSTIDELEKRFQKSVDIKASADMAIGEFSIAGRRASTDDKKKAPSKRTKPLTTKELEGVVGGVRKKATTKKTTKKVTRD